MKWYSEEAIDEITPIQEILISWLSLKILKEEADKHNISLKEIAYLGNDVTDIDCLNKVGLSACVLDSYPKIIEKCMYVTKTRGGWGAVREFCDFIIGAKNNNLS